MARVICADLRPADAEGRRDPGPPSGLQPESRPGWYWRGPAARRALSDEAFESAIAFAISGHQTEVWCTSFFRRVGRDVILVIAAGIGEGFRQERAVAVLRLPMCGQGFDGQTQAAGGQIRHALFAYL